MSVIVDSLEPVRRLGQTGVKVLFLLWRVLTGKGPETGHGKVKGRLVAG